MDEQRPPSAGIDHEEEEEEEEYDDFVSYVPLGGAGEGTVDVEDGEANRGEEEDELEEEGDRHWQEAEREAGGAVGGAAEPPGPSLAMAAGLVEMKMRRMDREYAEIISTAGTKEEQEARAAAFRALEQEIREELERSASEGARVVPTVQPNRVVPTESEDEFDPFGESQTPPRPRSVSPMGQGQCK